MAARYRKVAVQIWGDAKFRKLSDRAKLAFLFVLTHPGMTSIGAMRTSLPGLAAEIGWTAEGFREAFAEVAEKGLARHDDDASFLCLPNFLKHNRPENPNVVKSWRSHWDALPECELQREYLREVTQFVGKLPKGFKEAFAKSFEEPFSKCTRKPEPEPEHEPEHDRIRRKGGESEGRKISPAPSPRKAS